jgi:probable non-F420 flavinoid oxidoreductase
MGFQAIMCSDHFHPWSERQGQSGFAFAWLGAALQLTSLSFGSVCAPGYRYHPAVVAQATATLAEMFPGRYWVALGSGQLLNEHITGEHWPGKDERNARLKECADIIRRLWAGERVDHHGRVCVDDALLYTRPKELPLLIGAALTASTAEWLGSWVDGLITVVQPREKLQELIDRFRQGGGAGKPLFLQAQHSYAPQEEEALQGAYDQWRASIFASNVATQIKTTEQFDAAAQVIQPETLRKYVRISADLNQHIEWLSGDAAMGFDRVYIHNVNRDQEQFIRAFGKDVLPALRS